ncbi:glycosyl hydrolase family 18 protein [Eisenbergiella porci]|uniref:glycosyl hydrolase family 18 protein n=1 Tax=Eisenbergiella porci TaxID=2652274 RepID=UPI002A817FF7|nr:glycosyl hydrolase family 18 protein [Eisenbergiella porci]
MQIYVVKQGDTVDTIAGEYGVSVEDIIYDNQIPYPYRLAVGMALLLRITGEEGAGRYDAYVNGYAYPFISNYVLNQTLPYLSSLSIFSYGFTTEGNLIPPAIDESFMIQAALLEDVAPILTLTPFGADGMFNNYLISVLVNNQPVRDTLIAQLLFTMEQKGYQGVDIDFEYILPEDRDAFTAFVAETRAAANAEGYTLSVALAPKISDTQTGLLYEGKDYEGLGRAADSVLLMTYEWGYTYGPPMAVAPLNKVIEVVEYAITKIPPEKIDLGIPNYGYDWTLPYIRGESKADTIGNIEAVQIAIENNAEILFDSTAMSPWFRYTKDGVEHEVWFEDVRSLREKFRLVKSYGLRGMGYWQIMQLFRANWLLLADTFSIQKRPVG